MIVRKPNKMFIYVELHCSFTISALTFRMRAILQICLLVVFHTICGVNCIVESSNHWSLLIIDMVNQKSYHLDSSRPSNAEAAIITYRRLQPLLNWLELHVDELWQ